MTSLDLINRTEDPTQTEETEGETGRGDSGFEGEPRDKKG